MQTYNPPLAAINPAWKQEYKDPGYLRRCRIKFQRAQGLCEDDGENPAVVIHHRSYRWGVKDCPLSEMLALCLDCHYRRHFGLPYASRIGANDNQDEIDFSDLNQA